MVTFVCLCLVLVDFICLRQLHGVWLLLSFRAACCCFVAWIVVAFHLRLAGRCVYLLLASRCVHLRLAGRCVHLRVLVVA